MMSNVINQNDIKLQNMFRAVTKETLMEFLNDCGVDELRCPVCGGDSMAIPNVAADDGTQYLIPIDTNEISYKDKYWITNYKYRVICRICGHEIYFNAWPISDWIAIRNKENGNDGK